ncbi:MAG: homoserine dehydrogenase [Candidatus Omnitrophica bacterium]|nr:homoserine dehydrogenase [Candidatus Omnitrophota bacterium]
MVKKVGIIGLGIVGEATLNSLLHYQSLIKKRTSLTVCVSKVCDINPRKKKLIRDRKVKFTSNPHEVLNDPEIDVVVELIGGIHPAKGFILEALKNKKHVVTANKALLATSGKEIFQYAHRAGRNIGFEASVCGAIPLIKSISEGLIGCDVRSLYGILNGTTNYILYKMSQEQMSFKDALKDAQAAGFAEKHPHLDIEGKDTVYKLCILSYLSFGVWPNVHEIFVEGISKINPLDILYAHDLAYRIKLLAIARKEKKTLSLRVHPTLIREDHPLSEVDCAVNGVWLDTHPAGELLFYGEGAGGVPTSSAIIADIVSVCVNRGVFAREEWNCTMKSIDELRTRYYLRCMVLDMPGVLAKITRILALHKISIASVHQKERAQGEFVPIVLITHDVQESNVKNALQEIDKLKEVKKTSQCIRIEDI